MEYGHVVISNTKKGFVQSAIRFFTNSNFSHTLFTIPSCVGKEMAIEAASMGIMALPFDSMYRQNDKVSYRVYRFKTDPALKDIAIGNSLENLESGYGFLELAWFMWRGVNKWLGRDIKGKDNWSQAGIICSELTAKYISDAGFERLFAGYGKGSVHAQDVMDICEANPDIFELIEVKD